MVQFNSPGVAVQETVYQAASPSFSTSSAALVGYNNVGPIIATLVTSPLQFLNQYTVAGQVALGSFFQYCALAYLTQGTQLYAQRVTYRGVLYGGARIKISTSAQQNVALTVGAATNNFVAVSGNQDLFEIFAANPGGWGDFVGIQINSVNVTLNTFQISIYLDNPFTGVVTNVENWTVSMAQQLNGYGQQQYIATVINGISQFISVGVNSAYSSTTMPIAQNTILYLGGGYDGSSTSYTFTVSAVFVPPADGSIYTNNGQTFTIASTSITGGAGTIIAAGTGIPSTTGSLAYSSGAGQEVINFSAYSASSFVDADCAIQWAQFSNEGNFDVALLINGGQTGAGTQSAMLAVCDSRLDCIGIFDHPFYSNTLPSATVASNVVTFRTMTQNFNDQRATLYSPWLKIMDQWNNQIEYIPPSGYVAAQYAYNDYVSYPWLSPAGFTRGIINVIGVSTVYAQGDRDILYENQINAIQLFRGSGIVIYGDKNLTTTPGIFDRINTRRSVDFIEKALSIILQNFLFENNTPTTQAKVTSSCLYYLQGLAAGGAFNPIGPNGTNDNGYSVICNSTNNTPAIISAHQLVVDVYIRPAQSINYILLRANILDSSVSIQTLTANGTLL